MVQTFRSCQEKNFLCVYLRMMSFCRFGPTEVVDLRMHMFLLTSDIFNIFVLLYHAFKNAHVSSNR